MNSCFPRLYVLSLISVTIRCQISEGCFPLVPFLRCHMLICFLLPKIRRNQSIALLLESHVYNFSQSSISTYIRILHKLPFRVVSQYFVLYFIFTHCHTFSDKFYASSALCRVYLSNVVFFCDSCSRNPAVKLYCYLTPICSPTARTVSFRGLHSITTTA